MLAIAEFTPIFADTRFSAIITAAILSAFAPDPTLEAQIRLAE